MRKFILLLLLLSICNTLLLAQTDTTIISADTTYWRKSLSVGVNLNQSSFSSNWKAGGTNSVALGTFLNSKANYKRDRISWDNELKLQYGVIKNSGQEVRKSSDVIFLDTKYGYAISDDWNMFISGNFISQFDKGYDYDVDDDGTDVLISNFMSPGFLTFAAGLEYKPVPYFSIRFSPFAPRFTFLTDENVGRNERYGVPEGDKVRTEWLAALIQADFDKDIATNLNLKFSYQGFANYESLAFKTIDHRLTGTLTAKVNKFLSANLTGNLIYDRDQDDDIQFSQALAIGLFYNIQNYKEEKK